MEPQEPQIGWYYIIPLSLLVIGGFAFLAWINIDGMQDLKSKAPAPKVEIEDFDGQVIEFIPDDPVEEGAETNAIEEASTEDSEMASTTEGKTSVEMASTTASTTEDEIVEEVKPVAKKTNITDEYKSILLDAHNTARENLGLQTLLWSDDLEFKAQSWADDLATRGCELEHSNTRFGENIYYSWTTGDLVLNPQKSTDRWVSEADYYDYSSNTCADGKDCGHYTQMVWADTTSLGCGVSTCSIDGKNTQMWVCQYDPAGNVAGDKPY